MRFLLFIISLVFSASYADYLITSQSGTVIKVSATEPNLLEAQNGKINTFVFSDGVIEHNSDHEAGVIYFRPLQEGPRSGFIEVKYKDKSERISLVLVADDTLQSQRIIIADLSSTKEQDEESSVSRVEGDTQRNKTIKNILRGLVSDQGEIKLSATTYSDKLLSHEITFSVQANAYINGWEILAGKVKNNSSKQEEIDIAEIAKLNPGTIAVGAHDLNIDPNEELPIYLIKTTPIKGL